MEIIIACAIIGCLPAAIAQSKGRSFVGWWIYGALLFIVALPHSLMLKPEPKPAPKPTATDVADELTKFADLKERGVITEEEFQVHKARIMKQFEPSIITGRPAMGEGQY